VHYKIEKPIETTIFFDKSSEIVVDTVLVKQDELEAYVKGLVVKSNPYQFYFDKKMSFDAYINSIIYLHSVNLKTGDQFVL
jgi:hypothetical protein